LIEKNASGDFIYTDVEFRHYRRRRAERLLYAGAGILIAFAIGWSAVALTRGDWAMLVLQSLAVAGATWVWFLLHRGRLGLASHAYFLIVIPLVIGLITIEGVSGPFRSMSHLHLLPLTVGAYLLFFEHSTRARRIYGGACLAIFAVVELGLIRLPPLGLPYDIATQQTGRWILFFANFAALMLVSRLFVMDLAEAEKRLARTNARLEALVENMLPPAISQRLRREGRTFADAFGACSVLFADIVGYTPLSESAPNVVDLLDAIFSRFDDLTEHCGLEKIKTIGDAYMVAAGIPTARPDHAAAVCELALRMQAAIKEFPGLEIRIGINSGAVVAGVIGKKRFIYDLWGDTVNIAARMESQGISGQIQISEATRALLPLEFVCEDRGEIPIKGKGQMRVFLLKGLTGTPEAGQQSPSHAVTGCANS
jgi:adenylate cyclase